MNYNPYVPWDVGFLYSGINALRSNIGTAFNIGLWIFLIVSGIYIIINIVDKFGN